ncbi:MAG: glycosyltransferase family 39 protein [Planctomycetes bacterium]|nr:glycosyltransferase family 39 protein [Planctomycetota bacterium]
MKNTTTVDGAASPPARCLVDGPQPAAAPRWYGRALWGLGFAGLLLIILVALPVAWFMHSCVWLIGALPVIAVLILPRLGLWKWIMRLPTAHWLMLLAIIALLVRLACVLFVPYEPCADFRVYHAAAVTMSRDWVLGVPGRRTYQCFFPPGQVFGLAVMYRLFAQRVVAGQLLNVVYATLTVLGIWYIARGLFGGFVARIAGLLAAFLPSTVFACMLLGAEVPEAFWLVLAMCIFVGSVQRSGRILPALLCGLCLGVGSLVRPTYVLLPIAIGVHMLLSWPNRKRAILVTAVMTAGMAVAVLPWTLRNYAVTGGFLLISSNAGGNLYSANNDLAEGAYTESAWDYVFSHGPDDLALQKVGMDCAKDWIRHNPGRFAVLAVKKFGMFWATDKEIPWWALEQPGIEQPKLRIDPFWSTLAQAGTNGYYIACLIAAAAGLWRFRLELIANRHWSVIVVLAMYFTAVHMVFESQGKYHYMLIPPLMVLSALASAGVRSNSFTDRPL